MYAFTCVQVFVTTVWGDGMPTENKLRLCWVIQIFIFVKPVFYRGDGGSTGKE